MINTQYLAILMLQEVKAWNKWREDNPDIKPDLRGACFMVSPFMGANLWGANFRNTDLSEANLCGAKLIDVNFSGANLSNANLRDADLRQANLSNANLNRATLHRANLSEAKLRGAKLINANLSSANVRNADLSDTDLNEAYLREANFIGANLRNADLRGANLFRANLRDADLRGAKLHNANLADTDLSGKDLSGVNLSGTCLVKVRALDTNFEKAILTGACIQDWNINRANLDDVDCDYVYLQYNQQKILPIDRKFKQGEFTKLFQADCSYNRLSVLETSINDFESLLNDNPQGDESLFHDFLKKHPCLLDLYAINIESKPTLSYPDGESPLGKKYVEPDFIIRYPGSKYKLVELERPGKHIATKQGQTRSEVNQATFQIAEWITYIQDYSHFIKNKYPNILSHHSAMVVISRRTEKSFGSERNITNYMKIVSNQYRCEVCLYDDLLDRAKQAHAALVSLSWN